MTRFDTAATALNAFWLHRSRGWSRALVVDEDPARRSSVAESLRHALGEVRTASDPHARTSDTASFEPGTADLIWLGGTGSTNGSDAADIERLLGRCRRTLTPGGGLLWLTQNPSYWGGYGPGTGSRMGRLVRRLLRRGMHRDRGEAESSLEPRAVLARAGFEVHGAYYLDRDTSRSSSLIPISRPATRAYESRFRATGSPMASEVRSRLASTGIHPLLYPQIAWLGTRTEPSRDVATGDRAPGSGRKGWLIEEIERLEPPGLDSVAASSVVLLKNRSLLPFSERPTPSRRGDGYNAAVLDSDGRPAYYAKCRVSGYEGAAREADLMVTLGDDPEFARIVPPAWTSESDGMRLLLSRYLHGDTLHAILSSTRGECLAPMLEEVLDRCDRIRTSSSYSGEAQGQSDDTTLLQRARPALERISRTTAGDPRTLATLETALERAGEVGRVEQHGDLWPQNIVRCDGTWWLLDFEAYGTITVPLFDTLQLTRNTLELIGTYDGRRGGGMQTPPLGTLDALRELVGERARRLRLDATAVRGVLAYFAASTLARHADDPGSAPARTHALSLVRATTVALARSEAEGASSVDVIDVLAPASSGAPRHR